MNSQWMPRQQSSGFPSLLPPLQPTGFARNNQYPMQPTGFSQGSAEPLDLQGGYQSQTGPFLAPLASQQQVQQHLSPSPAPQTQKASWQGGGGLGFPSTAQRGVGAGSTLFPQMTGFQNLRTGMMSSPFTQPFAPSRALQLQQSHNVGMKLQQSPADHNQATTNMTWALSKEERKSYDQIFRAWDPLSSGFIDGSQASEIFGQSGLSREDLTQIWTLSDSTDRGSLNLPEFHIAMGLIYRRLNGHPLPGILPAGLAPLSERGLDSSVNFLKDLLDKDSRERALNPSTSSYAKSRSVYDTSPAGGVNPRKGSAAYIHKDADVQGYMSSSRHVDRKAVHESTTDDLNEMKRQPKNTASTHDEDAEKSGRQTEEDNTLDDEMDDLKYRIKRAQEDLDRVSRWSRSAKQDKERIKLERELLELMHEKIPEIERKIHDRERRREEENNRWARERNKRYDTYSKYGDDRNRYSSSRQGRSYDRDREDDMDRDYDDRYRGTSRRDNRDRDRDRYQERPRDLSNNPFLNMKNAASSAAPSPAAGSAGGNNPFFKPPQPPPAPAPPLPPAKTPAAPPTPTPTSSTLSASTKNMTPAERQAFNRSEAQRRMQERIQALGVTPSSASRAGTTVGSGVEERLVEERKEAEAKAKQAEKEAEEREKARKARLDEAKAIRSPPPAPVVPPVSNGAPPARAKPAPPPGRQKAPAPPPPEMTGYQDPRMQMMSSTFMPSFASSGAPQLQRNSNAGIDLRQSLAQHNQAARGTPAPKISWALSKEERKSYDQIFRAWDPLASGFIDGSKAFKVFGQSGLGQDDLAKIWALADSTNRGSLNLPEFHVAMGLIYRRLSGHPLPDILPPELAPPSERDLDSSVNFLMDLLNKDSHERAFNTSTPSYAKSRLLCDTSLGGSVNSRKDGAVNVRQAADAQGYKSISRPTPPPPPRALMYAARAAVGPEANAPFAPPPSSASAPSAAPPAGRNTLLEAIQSGTKLKKVVTNDRSISQFSGTVIGDPSPPSHQPAAEPPVQPVYPTSAPELDNAPSFKESARKSVDWYAGLAADGMQKIISAIPGLASRREEDEGEEAANASAAIPSISVADIDGSDDMADVDRSVEHRAKTLYPYEGQRQGDLSFAENLIVIAHPSKSGDLWWYGTLVKDGRKGFFPSSHVEVIDEGEDVWGYGTLLKDSRKGFFPSSVTSSMEGRLAEEREKAETNAKLRRARSDEANTTRTTSTAPIGVSPTHAKPASPAGRQKAPAPPPPTKKFQGITTTPPVAASPKLTPPQPLVVQTAAPVVDLQADEISRRQEALRKRVAQLKELEQLEDEARLLEERYQARRTAAPVTPPQSFHKMENGSSSMTAPPSTGITGENTIFSRATESVTSVTPPAQPSPPSFSAISNASSTPIFNQRITGPSRVPIRYRQGAGTGEHQTFIPDRIHERTRPERVRYSPPPTSPPSPILFPPMPPPPPYQVYPF